MLTQFGPKCNSSQSKLTDGWNTVDLLGLQRNPRATLNFFKLLHRFGPCRPANCAASRCRRRPTSSTTGWTWCRARPKWNCAASSDRCVTMAFSFHSMRGMRGATRVCSMAYIFGTIMEIFNRFVGVARCRHWTPARCTCRRPRSSRRSRTRPGRACRRRRPSSRS